MKVKNIMTAGNAVISVQPETKVVDVANILFSNNFNGVPVIDDGKLVGIITEGDLITKNANYNIHIPSLIKLINSLKIAGTVSSEQKKCMKHILSSCAKDVMNKEFTHIDAEASIQDLIDIFVKKNLNPIPVLSPRGKLEGIVSKADLIKFIGNFKGLI